MPHANVERLQHFLDAYESGDAAAVGELIAPDAVWHVGGTHRLSGDYRGREAILEYFNTVSTESSASLRLHPMELLANDVRGAIFLRVTGERGGRQLDVTMAEAIVFAADGTIAEYWAHATDQDAINSFWA